MARLHYTAIASLDGYVVDAAGSFAWAAPSEEVHAFVNDRERTMGTYLYGRRMYDVMRYWGGADDGADKSQVSADYRRIWQAADKVVFSSTLAEVTTRRTSLERTFDVHRRLEGDVSIGGPTRAAVAL